MYDALNIDILQSQMRAPLKKQSHSANNSERLALRNSANALLRRVPLVLRSFSLLLASDHLLSWKGHLTRTIMVFSVWASAVSFRNASNYHSTIRLMMPLTSSRSLKISSSSQALVFPPPLASLTSDRRKAVFTPSCNILGCKTPRRSLVLTYSKKTPPSSFQSPRSSFPTSTATPQLINSSTSFSKRESCSPITPKTSTIWSRLLASSRKS